MKIFDVQVPLTDNDAFELLHALRNGYSLPDNLCAALYAWADEVVATRDELLSKKGRAA